MKWELLIYTFFVSLLELVVQCQGSWLSMSWSNMLKGSTSTEAMQKLCMSGVTHNL